MPYLNRSNLYSDRDRNEPDGPETGTVVREPSFPIEEGNNNGNFWEQMNMLLDTKLNKFKEKLNTNIKVEIKKATDPMKTELDKLTAENKKINTELTVIKSKQKEEKERNDKMVKVLKEHQTTITRSEKEMRLKRLILAGVPEDDITINGKPCKTDADKVNETLKSMDSNVSVSQCRRLGAKDRGSENRPRFIQIEFMNITDRNKVNKLSEKLKHNDDTKLFYLKADRSKEEREEYKRLRDVKKGLLEEGKTAEIKYGKLYVDDTCVDQINTKVNDFLC